MTRLEEGTSADRWHQSCISLVKSRFDKDSLAKFSIDDINVSRVIRIHNRFQRNKFEEKVEQHLDMSKPGFKKSFEYLFIGMHPDRAAEFHQLVKNGHATKEENLRSGRMPFGGLHNTVPAVDLHRINYYKQKYLLSEPPYTSKLELHNKVPKGYLLLCKVLLLKMQKDPKNPTFDMNNSPEDIYQKHPISKNLELDSEVLVSFRDAEKSLGKLDHKLYFIHDSSLILPEYLVEFNYEYSNIDRSVCHIGETMLVLNTHDLTFQLATSDKQNEIKIDSSLKSKIEEIQMKYSDPKGSDLQSIQFFSLEEFYKSGMEHLKTDLLNYLIYFENSVVDMLPYKPKMQVLEQYKKERKGKLPICEEDEAAQVEHLSIRLHSLLTFPLDFDFKKIKELDISSNFMKDTAFVKRMPQLECLKMFDNQLETLCPELISLKSLKQLDISFNKIKDINQIRLLKDSPSLVRLNVRGNPLCKMFPRYQDILVAMIAGLAEIDGKPAGAIKQRSKSNINCSLTESLIIDCQKKAEFDDTGVFQGQNMQISSIFITTPLYDLKIVNLSNNGLTKLDGIQFIKNLIELTAENNQITDITDVGHLVELRKLELGSNLIVNVGHALTGLKSLTLLSIENNRLTSLASFSELENLLELYVGENLVDDLKEIRHLSNLKHLLVMDLWGNPLCRDKEFRLFCIFHIKELKVLDGYPIQPKELEDSKQAYTGKLSEELLAERLLGKNMETLLSMDLSYCSLRDFDNIFNNKKFPKVAEINLAGNFFTTLKCFGYLPTLRELNMTDNRLSSFEPLADAKSKIGLNGIPNIEVLHLSKNKIPSLDTLKMFHLPRLLSLKLSGNLIKKMHCVNHFSSLRDLDLSSNRLKTIDTNSIDPTMRLEYLCLNENFLRSVNNLYMLPCLRHLYVRYNRLTEFGDIEGLLNVENLTELDISSNPLSRKYGYRLIILQKMPSLTVLDSQPLSSEEKEKLEMIFEREQMANPKSPDRRGVPGNQPPNGRQVRMSSINFE